MAGDKFLEFGPDGHPIEKRGTQTSAGAGNAGDLVALTAAGTLDPSLFEAGFGSDVVSITASENLAGGDFVNVHLSTGVKVRKADASAATKHADGFVRASVTSGQPASVYFAGINDAVSGATIGATVFLSETAGGFVETSPTGAGVISQTVGVAISATAIAFVKGAKYEQIA